jgi:hypothetical protein
VLRFPCVRLRIHSGCPLFGVLCIFSCVLSVRRALHSISYSCGVLCIRRASTIRYVYVAEFVVRCLSVSRAIKSGGKCRKKNGSGRRENGSTRKSRLVVMVESQLFLHLATGSICTCNHLKLSISIDIQNSKRI